ncbi:unnamed protein product [Auanema sp. JU1783]|nr:unnamed protein product [Auanema sp. JU1783]
MFVFNRAVLTLFRRSYSSSNSSFLCKVYEEAKARSSEIENAQEINARGVFVNNELSLQNIDVYGFDYDYTLAVYKRELNTLIYNLAAERLITQFKYPEGIKSIPYDMSFAIRGLHFDIQNCCFLKVDAFSQIQRGTVFRGTKKLTDDDVVKIYKGFGLPDVKGRDLPQLMDLFSLPWAGLLSTVIEYFDNNKISFDPKCLYDDLAECVRQVHISGQMYEHVGKELTTFVHPNVGLKDYLDFLCSSKKELFVVTNSPFNFINTGMTYMLGNDWRKYFNYIVVSAKKPTFFYRSEPFRLYDVKSNALHFGKVKTLETGNIYSNGNIKELSERAGFEGKGVLYFGDHIYTDLADPMLRLGWHTAAIVPELAREIRIQNSNEYRFEIIWLESLTQLIEKYQSFTREDPLCKEILQEWMKERCKIRENVKNMFNPQFGSLFRTYLYKPGTKLNEVWHQSQILSAAKCSAA